MSLHKCPTEALLRIFDFLNHVGDLVSLSCTSRTFHEIVEGLLYSKFTETKSSDLPLLLRTIIENPKLGEHFRNLEVCEEKPEEPKSFRHMFNHAHKWTSLRTRLEEYYTPYKTPVTLDYVNTHVEDHLARLNGTFDWDLLVSTVLLYTPNLETLDFIWKSGKDEFNTLAILAKAERLQQVQLNGSTETSRFSFPRIKHISIASRLPIDRIDEDVEYISRLKIGSLLPVLKIGSLQSFSCDGIFSGDSFYCRDDAISLKRLSLTSCALSSLYRSKLLKACASLQHFHFGHHYPKFDVKPSTVFPALFHLANTLVSLTILNEYIYNDPRDPDHEPLPCLSSFTKLKSLEISYGFIFTKRVMRSIADNHTKQNFTFSDLPPSLISFTTRDTKPEYLDELDSMDILTALPNLERIGVHFNQMARSDREPPIPVDRDQRRCHAIDQAYRAKGIDVTFTYKWFSGGDDTQLTYY